MIARLLSVRLGKTCCYYHYHLHILLDLLGRDSFWAMEARRWKKCQTQCASFELFWIPRFFRTTGNSATVSSGLQVASWGMWTLPCGHAIRIARQCRCEGECCSGVKPCVREIIYRFIDLCHAMRADQHRQIQAQSECGH